MRGFTLVETVVALLLLMVALLLGLALVLEQPRVARRLDGQLAALEALETTVEALRVGVLPLVSTELPATEVRPARFIEVTPDGVRPHLFRVQVRVRYVVLGRTLERRLETLIWSPP